MRQYILILFLSHILYNIQAHKNGNEIEIKGEEK